MVKTLWYRISRQRKFSYRIKQHPFGIVSIPQESQRVEEPLIIPPLMQVIHAATEQA